MLRSELHFEGGALAGVAGDGDFAVVVGDDGFGDGKAEAGVAGTAGAGFVNAIEAIKQMGEVFGGDAGAVVLNGEGGVMAGGGAMDVDFAAWMMVVLDGVHQQIGGEHVDHAGIADTRSGGEMRL